MTTPTDDGPYRLWDAKYTMLWPNPDTLPPDEERMRRLARQQWRRAYPSPPSPFDNYQPQRTATR
jgi:hypothetical protein